MAEVRGSVFGAAKVGCVTAVSIGVGSLFIADRIARFVANERARRVTVIGFGVGLTSDFSGSVATAGVSGNGIVVVAAAGVTGVMGEGTRFFK